MSLSSILIEYNACRSVCQLLIHLVANFLHLHNFCYDDKIIFLNASVFRTCFCFPFSSFCPFFSRARIIIGAKLIRIDSKVTQSTEIYDASSLRAAPPLLLLCEITRSHVLKTTTIVLPPTVIGDFEILQVRWRQSRSRCANFVHKTFCTARRNAKFHGLIRARYYHGIYEGGHKDGRIRNRLTFSWIKSRYRGRCLKASLWQRVYVEGFSFRRAV